MGGGAGSVGLGQACRWLELAPGLGGVLILVEREQRGAQAQGLIQLQEMGAGVLLAPWGRSSCQKETQAEGRQQEVFGIWAGGSFWGSHSQQLHPLGLVL